MHCLAETLAATDEASPRPLAMAEGRRKQEWGEADGEGLRGTVPPAPAPLGRPLSDNPAH